MAATTTPTDLVSEFLDRLRELYANIKEWIGEEDPKAKFAQSYVELNEQFTGRYKAKKLKVTRPGRCTLTFTPKAATVLGARGLVEVESPLGFENLLWVYAGGPAIGFEESAHGAVVSPSTHLLYPGVPEGWAWENNAKVSLEHLTRDVFLKRIVRPLSE